ncbi:MAG TPA: calcium/sodium antiporter [Gammaproteobacteria bacterium]|jgi:cation:H+ antiporter
MTLVFFIGGLGLLYVGGEILVSSAAALGKRLHLSPLVAGLTIVAFATSAPELAISISAATNDLPGLAIGNVIGSNICNIALILGIVTILKPAPVRQTLVRRDVLVMALTTLLVPGLLLDGSLARVEGALLVTCIVVYIVLTLWHARATRSQRTPDENVVPTLTENVGLNAVLAVVGLVILVTGSRLFVEASVAIAMIIGVPAAVVGLSAAALGSSLPELTASIIAARHGQPEMAAGNLIGSNIFNLLLILGATSLLQPLTMRSVTLIDLGAMIAITGLALSLMLTRARLERTEGFVLVAAYCIYMVWIYVQPAAN